MKWQVLLVILMFLVFSCGKTEEKDSSMENNTQSDSLRMQEKRGWMVKAQIESRGVKDSMVLKAMRKVPRHLFVPKSYQEEAYADEPLPIGEGQTISQPYIVALMTELLGLKGGERVLEIGTGSGYQAAILAELAREVYTVEIIPELAAAAPPGITREGYRNVHVKQGDGALGWREYGPYDAVVVTAAAPSVPRALIDQLEEGGV